MRNWKRPKWKARRKVWRPETAPSAIPVAIATAKASMASPTAIPRSVRVSIGTSGRVVSSNPLTKIPRGRSGRHASGHVRILFEQDRRRSSFRNLPAGGAREAPHRQGLPPPLLHQGPPRKSPAPRGRRHGHGGRHPGPRELVAERAVGPRDRISPGARAPAGFHRRPRAGRPGGDARRGEADGRGPEAGQPADPGGPRDRPPRAGGPVRRRDRPP